MRTLPKFSPGTKLNDISARLWQNVSDELTRARHISSGPGIVVTDTAGGINISLAKPATTTSSADVMTVVVTRADAGDKVLLVREVQYADGIPVSGDYAVVGPAFGAYPAIGVSLAAFADSVTTGTPTIDSAFFTARRRSTIWFVDGPGGSGGGTTIAQYKFVGFMGIGGTGFSLDTPTSSKSFHDAFRCHKYKADGATLVTGEDGTPTEFLVMLPYLLRGGPFDSQGNGSPRAEITYTNVSAQSRIATRQDAGGGLQINEQQVITPSYRPGDRIFAAPTPALHPLSSERATLLDLNVDSRAWTRRRGQ